MTTTPTNTAKLFRHGRSQAVRLPKAFRFEGEEVRVSRIGHKVILEPLDTPAFDAEAFFLALDKGNAAAFLPEGLPEEAPLEADDTLGIG
jgi:antitoxin VapB